MRYPVWKTKSGEKIPINKMDDRHLLNSIRFLERRASHLKLRLYSSYPEMNGEMAQYCAEQEFEAFQNADVGDIFPIYDRLYDLAIKRNLL